MPPVIDIDKCNGCGICEECPTDVIYMKKVNGREVAYAKYPDECWHCNACRMDCPEEAIDLVLPLASLIL